MRTIREFLNITKSSARIRATICSAIKSRRVIEFYYHGGFRTVVPFCLGLVLAGEADNESLLCYQVGGYSEFGNHVGWKLLRASEISDLEITGQRFNGARPGYDPDNVEMTTIYCCVSMGADDNGTAEEATELEPKIEGKIPSYKTPRKNVVSFLTHNELMRRFRLSHPIPLSELYKKIFTRAAK